MEGPRRVYVGPKNALPYNFGRRTIPSRVIHSTPYNSETKIETALYKSFLPDFREKSQRDFALNLLASGDPVRIDTWDPSLRDSLKLSSPEKYSETLEVGTQKIEADFDLEEGAAFYRFLLAIAHKKLDLNTSLAYAVSKWTPSIDDIKIFKQSWETDKDRKFYAIDAGYNSFEKGDIIRHADMLGVLARDLDSQIPEAVLDIVNKDLVGHYVQLTVSPARNDVIEGILRSVIIDGSLHTSLDYLHYHADIYNIVRSGNLVDFEGLNSGQYLFTPIVKETKIIPSIIQPSF